MRLVSQSQSRLHLRGGEISHQEAPRQDRRPRVQTRRAAGTGTAKAFQCVLLDTFVRWWLIGAFASSAPKGRSKSSRKDTDSSTCPSSVSPSSPVKPEPDAVADNAQLDLLKRSADVMPLAGVSTSDIDFSGKWWQGEHPPQPIRDFLYVYFYFLSCAEARQGGSSRSERHPSRTHYLGSPPASPSASARGFSFTSAAF